MDRGDIVQWVLVVTLTVCGVFLAPFFAWVGVRYRRELRRRESETRERNCGLISAELAVVERHMQDGRVIAPVRSRLPARSVPDGFRTGYGRRTHAVAPWEDGSHVKVIIGGEICKSYCGLETEKDSVVGEVLVDCQSCLRSLASESAEIRKKLTKDEPLQRRTAWDHISEEDPPL